MVQFDFNKRERYFVLKRDGTIEEYHSIDQCRSQSDVQIIIKDTFKVFEKTLCKFKRISDFAFFSSKGEPIVLSANQWFIEDFQYIHRSKYKDFITVVYSDPFYQIRAIELTVCNEKEKMNDNDNDINTIVAAIDKLNELSHFPNWKQYDMHKKEKSVEFDNPSIINNNISNFSNNVEVCFSNIRSVIAKRLKESKIEIKVAVCWFTNKYLFEILCKKLIGGVPVSLIVLNDLINNKPDGLDFQRFINLGGKFYFSNIESPMHNKYCVIDRQTVLSGSYNWTYFSENKNKENLIIIKDNHLAQKFDKNFMGIIESIPQVEDVSQVANRQTGLANIVEDAVIACETDIIIDSHAEYIAGNTLTSLPIGEKIHNDKFFEFIPKGSSIPIRRTYTLSTIKDNQTECVTDIRCGEEKVGSKNQMVDCFTVENIPPMKAGKAGLITTFSIDLSGILTIIVKVRETSKITIHKVNIKPLLIMK